MNSFNFCTQHNAPTRIIRYDVSITAAIATPVTSLVWNCADMTVSESASLIMNPFALLVVAQQLILEPKLSKKVWIMYMSFHST